MPTTLFQLVDL